MNILVLAAGFGKRMKDLTEEIPKPLLLYKNKPLISYALDLALTLDCENIFINVHYFPEQLIKYMRDHYPSVQISDESNKILDTGGGIKKILSNKKDLLVLNSDNWWDLDFSDDLKDGIRVFNSSSNMTNLLFTAKSKNSSDLNQNPLNNQIIIPSHNYNVQFQGCHIIRQNCLKDYPDVFPIQRQWKKASEKKTIFGHLCQKNVSHVGTKELYLKALS